MLGTVAWQGGIGLVMVGRAGNEKMAISHLIHRQSKHLAPQSI